MRAVFLSPMSLLIVATRESRSNGRGLFNDWFVQLQRHFIFFFFFFFFSLKPWITVFELRKIDFQGT